MQVTRRDVASTSLQQRVLERIGLRSPPKDAELSPPPPAAVAAAATAILANGTHAEKPLSAAAARAMRLRVRARAAAATAAGAARATCRAYARCMEVAPPFVRVPSAALELAAGQPEAWERLVASRSFSRLDAVRAQISRSPATRRLVPAAVLVAFFLFINFLVLGTSQMRLGSSRAYFSIHPSGRNADVFWQSGAGLCLRARAGRPPARPRARTATALFTPANGSNHTEPRTTERARACSPARRRGGRHRAAAAAAGQPRARVAVCRPVREADDEGGEAPQGAGDGRSER